MVTPETPFAQRFQSGRFYRIPGERTLLCALLCFPQAQGGKWVWEFRRRPDLSVAYPHVLGSFVIFQEDPDRVFSIRSDGAHLATTMDWRTFEPTVWKFDARRPGRGRVHRP